MQTSSQWSWDGNAKNQSLGGSFTEKFASFHGAENAGRHSPVVAENDNAQAFREDAEENWVLAASKELYHSAYSVKALQLTVVLVLLILCGTVETVNYSVNGQRYMAQYLTTLNILVVLGATIFFFGIVAVKLATDEEYYKNDSSWMWKGKDKGWFFFNIIGIAIFDTLALYLGILSSHNVTAPLRTLLQQASIPMTMGASWILLGRRYKAVHIVGCSAIILGIFLALYQILTAGNPVEEKDKESSDATWSIIFFFSCIPMAIGSSIKELVLTHETKRVDMHQVNAWVALFQLVLGLCITPLSYLAAIGPHEHLSFANFPQNMQDGLECGVWGDHTACNAQCVYVNGNVSSCYDIPGAHCDCGLDLAPVAVWVYVGVCCCFNLLMLYVIKEGTAVLFWISSAAIIPAVAVISSTSIYTWLDLGTVEFSVLQICGLVMVVVGIAIYRMQPEESVSLSPERASYTETVDPTRASLYHGIKELQHTSVIYQGDEAQRSFLGGLEPRASQPRTPTRPERTSSV